VWQVDESKNKILEQLQNVLYIQKEIEENDEREINFNYPLEGMEKEQELYEKFYTSIGKNILWWWD
jgi:hypothetical protein